MGRELLIGSGHRGKKLICVPGAEDWDHCITLDINPSIKPDIIFDLWQPILPFKENTFNEIHAYEVLEHVGHQGDYKFFFNQFDEFARILVPYGHIFITSPAVNSKWVWGDPGHTRYIGPESIVFLVRSEYERQKGKTPMTDYRSAFKSNWEFVFHTEQSGSQAMVLRSVKEWGR